MRFDPDKVIRQRVQLGFSQETLATLSNVSVRTVQRAERGEVLRRENMADIAAALKVPVHALLMPEEDQEIAGGEGDRLTLRRASSGREIFDLIDASRLCKVESNVDPTPDRLPALREAIAVNEPWIPDPWEDRPAFSSLVQRLEAIAALDAAMSRLGEHGLGIYVGRRVELAVMPQEFDEGWDVRRNQQPEAVSAGRILIADSAPEKRFVDAPTDWPVKVVRQSENERVA